jgi:hypothetical protein
LASKAGEVTNGQRRHIPVAYPHAYSPAVKSANSNQPSPTACNRAENSSLIATVVETAHAGHT